MSTRLLGKVERLLLLAILRRGERTYAVPIRERGYRIERDGLAALWHARTMIDRLEAGTVLARARGRK